MSIPSLTLRRLQFPTSTRLLATTVPKSITRTRLFSSSPATFKMPNAHQDTGTSTTGLSEWKTRPPYRVHEKNDDFDVKYEANCHCGKVQYQLSRREPLDSKLCHCTTCQTQHGKQ